MTVRRNLRAISHATLATVAAVTGLTACGSARAAQRANTSSSSSPSSTAPLNGAGECGTYTGTGCAPAAARVDLATPTFTHPTTITNPLFPVSTIASVVLLGQQDGKPFRSETSVLPRTTTVVWNGQAIEVVLSQYLAYKDGHIDEMALDRYAQADDGSVWYFGEDVFDYTDGTISQSGGTWLAGRDGPPAMIMPAHPKVGDAFRSENITGVVFEELRVKAVDQTVNGPTGPVHGAVVMDELHVDGATLSGKTFAPGYGEFITTTGKDIESVALANKTDVRAGGLPVPLANLSTSAWGALESVRADDWKAAAAAVKRTAQLWSTITSTPQPPAIVATMKPALAALTRAVSSNKAQESMQAAVDVAQIALDLQLAYRDPLHVDIERMHVHAQQLRVDAAGKSKSGVAAETAALEWIAQRILDRLAAADRDELRAQLDDLRAASNTENLAASADHAARLAIWLRSTSAAS